jgi:hypothetical protein
MTYQIYGQQHLQRKSIARLKQIYSEIGCTVEVTDKRCKDAWINAIIAHQSSQLKKVTDATEVKAKAENTTDTKIDAKSEVNELTTVEISFYDHEIYADSKLIASITHDDNHLTQRWVVMVNNKEVFRANTPMLCDRFICNHFKDGTLPVQEERVTEEPCTTGNEIIAQIATECEKFELEILDDGIYHNDVKLGEVGFSNGNWWFVRTDSTQQRVPCDSALDAVWWLSMVDVSLATEPVDEYLQYRSLEQLTGEELQRLLDAEVVDYEELLDRSFDELTPQEWQRLREYEPHLELVAA